MKFPTKPSKRQDLQGIRGLAIISVLGFHFYPHLFPNGYLGVDQFFVLSGFLMCMLLSQSGEMSVYQMFIHFYSRRFKRILPLYLLVILLTLLALYSVFPDSALLQNQSSAQKALIFVSNRQHTGEEDYFEKLSLAIDLFAHTWSLSVEIQFYLFVPIIFLIANFFTKPLIKFSFYFLLGGASLFYYLNSPKEIAFNSVFARIWQFLVGMITYSLSKETSPNGYQPLYIIENDEKSKETILRVFSKHFFLIPMVFVVSYPIELPSMLMRPLFTLFTGCLMLLSIDDEFLTKRVLTYFGDISYSLYLVHWPFYAYSKLEYSATNSALTIALLLSIITAVIIYETYEKWYLTLSDSLLIILTFLLFITNTLAIYKDVIQDGWFLEEKNQKVHNITEMSYDDAIRMNFLWNKYDLEAMKEPGCNRRTPGHVRWCDYVGNGQKLKIALFGNSFTLNHHRMIVQECREKVLNITMDSEKGCEPLAARPSDLFCVPKLEEFENFIKSVQPDYAFILSRFYYTSDPFESTNLEKDRTYLEMRSQLNKFLPYIKKKLFILDTIPRVSVKNVRNIAAELKNGKSIEEVNNSVVDTAGYERGRVRHASLVKECGSKCELIDYLPVFRNSTTNRIQYFDSKGFSYFTTSNHLSAHGIELIRPIYTKICHSF